MRDGIDAIVLKVVSVFHNRKDIGVANARAPRQVSPPPFHPGQKILDTSVMDDTQHRNERAKKTEKNAQTGLKKLRGRRKHICMRYDCVYVCVHVDRHISI
ncbi:hypothetical protein TNCV_437561 [Trichonephila clavipes]|nr:hypothetical protein TNCV_437561 [Trichonephila clavipes]